MACALRNASDMAHLRPLTDLDLAHRAALVLGVALVLGAAACGGGDSATGSGGSPGAGGSSGTHSTASGNPAGGGSASGGGGTGGSVPGVGPVCAAVHSDPDIKQALPATYLDTTYTAPTGKTVQVHAGDDLQAAINAAKPGDQLLLEAGATFTGPFVLPEKTGDDWIVIRTATADADFVAPGTRVVPGDAAKMAKIVTPQATNAFSTQGVAHHYRLIGLEVTPVDANALIYDLIALGDYSNTDPNGFAHDLILDRMYIHGFAQSSLKRCVQLSSARTSVIDSTIADCHVVGQDAQAIGGWAGPGPYKIVDDYLEGSGENVLFGGADPAAQNLVPSDIQFELNHVKKPLSWNASDPSYGGTHWSVKNSLELKNARRVLAQCNLFENNWADAQAGIAIVFTPRNSTGAAPWSTVEDVTFARNQVVNVTAGVNFLGTDDIYPSQRMQRVLVADNVFEGLTGLGYQLLGPTFVKIDHNTMLQALNIITADGGPTDHFFFTNNINPHNSYGIIGSGHGVGNDSIMTFFPGGVVTANVIVGGSASAYPAGNFFPATLDDVGFVDRAAGDYRLAATSKYAGKATDGSNVGADVAKLTQELAGVP
jgi:hypothetical protein